MPCIMLYERGYTLESTILSMFLVENREKGNKY